jgi:hypothetical protein
MYYLSGAVVDSRCRWPDYEFGFKGRVPAGRHAHPTLPGTLETPYSSNRLVDESGGVRLTHTPTSLCINSCKSIPVIRLLIEHTIIRVMSKPEEADSDGEYSSGASSAGPSRPVSRISQHSSSSTGSRKGKERASEVEEPEVIPDAGKPAKSVRTITTNGGESSEGEDDDDEDEEEEEPYV